MTQSPHDMKALIAESVAEALADAGMDVAQIQAMFGQGLTQPGPSAPSAAEMLDEITFKDVLESIDPKDSDAGLLMLDWLHKSGRLRRIGVLDGGQGYMWLYQEPKGSTREGHIPGGTQGDRIVDSAIEGMEQSGAKKVSTGLCSQCMSAVQDDGSGLPILVDEDAPDRDKCPGNGGGPHNMVS